MVATPPGVKAPRQTATTTANAIQIGGDHYKRRGIEPWDYAAANNLDAFQHAVVKYVTRYREKGGIEDLRKARHYIDKLIELVEHGYPETSPAYFAQQLQDKP